MNDNTKNEKSKVISCKKVYFLIKKILWKNKNYSIDPIKNIIVILDSNNEPRYKIKIPFFYPSLNEKDSLKSYLEKVPNSIPSYLVILIRSGYCSVGFYEDGKQIHYKSIRKYMVRKSQGKTQLTHLKTKGKSRLGSRIRLRQSQEFFEEINGLITEWDIIGEVEHIFYSCSVRLWSMLFQSKIKSSFNKEDNRLKKIPLDIKTPNWKELNKINQFIVSGLFIKLKK